MESIKKIEQMKRLHVFVSGMVQGVFFRAHTESWAQELGLTGWVKNLREGGVEIVAEGSEKNLKKLLELVKRGPPRAHVMNIKTSWEIPSGEFSFFGTEYDAEDKSE